MNDLLERMNMLSDKQLIILEGELSRNKKNVGIAYLLWLFVGSLGVHKFYIGKTGWGIAYLFMTVLGYFTGGFGVILSLKNGINGVTTALGVTVFGLAVLSLLGIFLAVDLFTIPRQIRKQEEKLKEKLLLDMEIHNYLA